MSDFSLLITSKILDSCFRRNDDYHPMNENVIPVKTGIQKGLSLIIILRIAQFRWKLSIPMNKATSKEIFNFPTGCVQAVPAKCFCNIPGWIGPKRSYPYGIQLG
jgi:hypothetical protein